MKNMMGAVLSTAPIMFFIVIPFIMVQTVYPFAAAYTARPDRARASTSP